MAGFNGRKQIVKWDAVTLVGVRSKGFTIANEHVDVTNDDDNGWRTLLAQPGLRSVEVTVAGITNNEVLIAEMMAASIDSEPLEVILPTSLTTPGKLSGSFFCSSFEQTGEHDGSIEFNATFMSSGVVAYTASV